MARRKPTPPPWLAWLRLAVIVVIMGGGLLGYRACSGWQAGRVNGREVVQLVRVSDGDTIVVQPAWGDTVRVRLIGIDTPELGTAESFRSALFLAELLEGAAGLEIEAEPTKPRDKYGRTLAWVWVRTADGRELLAQEELINEGLAEIYRDAKGSKYFDRLLLVAQHRR